MHLEPSTRPTLAPLSDEAIAERVIRGDTGAFELLMRRHNQRLFRAARSVLSNDSDAEDALQDAYVRIFQRLKGFAGRSRLVTWMTRIVFHEAIRLRQRRTRVHAIEHAGTDLEATLESPPPPQTFTSSQERMNAFQAALESLTNNERGVVMLRIIQGLSTRETAASLGLSESNVKVSLHRAKPKLAAHLEETGANEIRQALTFDGHRCDRLVAGVLRRLEDAPAQTSNETP